MKKKIIVLDDVDIQSVIMCVGREGGSDWWQLLSGSQLAEQLSLPPTCLEFSPPFFWVCVCVLVTRSYKGLWVSVCGPALSQVCTRGWCTRSLFLPPALHNTWESLKNFWRNFTQSYSDLESPQKKKCQGLLR